MLDLDIITVGKVGDGAGYLENAVVGAGGEAEAFHGFAKQHFAAFVDNADFLHHFRRHHRIGIDFLVIFKALGLALAGEYHTLADLLAAFRFAGGGDLLE